MSVSKQELLETIGNMSVLELSELIKDMEEKFGVSAQAAVAAAPAAGTGEAAEAEEEKDEFDVMLSSFGESKVTVIKAVRAVSGLGLKEAKDLVESAPVVVKEGANKEDADNIKSQLEAAGATVELK